MSRLERRASGRASVAQAAAAWLGVGGGAATDWLVAAGRVSRVGSRVRAAVFFLRAPWGMAAVLCGLFFGAVSVCVHTRALLGEIV